MMKKVGWVVVTLALAACSPQIDTSSPQSYAESVEKVKASLPADKQPQFEHALGVLAFGTDDTSESQFADTPISSPIFMAVADKINGKSGEAIIKLGADEERKLLTKEIAADAAIVARVRTERAKYAAVLDNLHISASSYSAPVDILGNREPELKFSLTNGSNTPIKGIMLDGRLTSPGRSVPWVEASVNTEIPGGIEPGETKPFDLAPNQFAEWQASDDFATRKDLSLALTVSNAESADGTPFLKSDVSTAQKTIAEMAKKQRRLNELNKASN